MSAPVRVLLVDDSRYYLALLRQALADAPGVEVVGTAPDGESALAALASLRPDAVTLDVEMPGLGGLGTLAAIEARNSRRPAAERVGVVMVSGLTARGADATVCALQAGAFDFVTKPALSDPAENLAYLRQQLSAKLRLFVLQRARPIAETPLPARSPPMSRRSAEAVVIASSTGGPKALDALLPDLCRLTDVPIFLVQHMPAGFTRPLAEGLARTCGRPAREALADEPAERGGLYVAPGGSHLAPRREGGRVLLGLTQTPPENGCRPAADVLFRAAAAAYDGRVVGVVLTGMDCDGARGAGAIRRAGGTVVVQDEATSVVWGMPGSVVRAGDADAVLPLGEIAAAVARLLRPGGT